MFRSEAFLPRLRLATLAQRSGLCLERTLHTSTVCRAVGSKNGRHRVVIVGAGFGGMHCINRLHGTDADITIIDRSNHHLFQPLLYQVGTCSLGASAIAWPIRHLVHKYPQMTTLLGEVQYVDKQKREVIIDNDQSVPYDTLVLATGARDTYFGHDEWAKYATGLKSMTDATTLRQMILMAFEIAERETDIKRQKKLLTFAIIGGGPTGVELAGAMSEMARVTLCDEFRRIDPRRARIVLIEAGPRLLSAFPESLSEYAKQSLEQLGTEVHLSSAVTELTPTYVEFGGQRLETLTTLWCAGVQASPAARWLDTPADHGGRVKVEKDLSVPGHPEIFAIGDTAMVVRGDDEQRVPGVAPAAKQMGKYVGNVIRNRLRDQSVHAPFHYVDLGNLATIGKNKAVVDFGFVRFKGRLAWWLWGIAHIFFLIGVRSRASVALTWLWAYTKDRRSARLITQNPRRNLPYGYGDFEDKGKEEVHTH
ncbi:hypothetical protein MVES1_001484 [Malassezia vespertilionis]|uniref:NADH:ubiquinone reductase (non-electrogenic) n=1 Tax=Malassezia vespertilionis TaxID=2020962 RepID=A0A2N1JD36_9BASI|nr:uncharacterized protein MVES1_001484 [Malassezia vespertilionis]PKI84480.1 hypothetical protein MVES_001398 [Malassezia vespertilionis]WFD06142.1 hypothetical protein MVES1_001484 [Malassezia vespertilionis]